MERRAREAKMSKLSDVPAIIEPGFDSPPKNGWKATHSDAQEAN